MRKRLLIFDLDGTLIDSGNDIVNATNETLSHFGHSALPAPVIIAHIGEGLKKLVFDFFPEAENDQNIRDQIMDVFSDYYSQHLLKTTTLFPGVEQFLSQWPHPISLVTNKPLKHTLATLEGLALTRFNWSTVFAADSLTERKPHPLPLLESIRKAGVTPEDTFMIGDGIPDMVAAQRAKVCAVACLYGYSAPEILKSYAPKAYLNQFSDLPKLLDTL